MLEAEVAGFGASGRNGGWCSALFPASLATLAAAVRLGAAARWPSTGRCARPSTRSRRVAAAEGIDAQLAKGGTVALARTAPSCAGPATRSRDARAWGRGEDDAAAARRRRGRARVLDAHRHARRRRTPRDCAAIHPARLVRGLAARGRAARRSRSTSAPAVTAIEPGRAAHRHGTVRAEVVVRATEGYTPRLAGPGARAWCRSTR